MQEKEINKDVSITDSNCTVDSKISLTPKTGRFCEREFLRYLSYLELCYFNHKLKTFPLL